MSSSAATTLLSVSVSFTVLAGLPKKACADEVAKKYVVRDEATTTGPNRALLHSGIWTLGVAYVPALIVATESSRAADRRLYIPVAGPWLDLSSRGKCPANDTCDHETTNRVLLAVDGVFQGIGALNVIGSFLFPETRTVTVGSKHPEDKRAFSVHLTPTRVDGAYGLAAVGTF